MSKSLLCQLAESFPLTASRILQRDEGLKKRFREESITDLLMCSLIPLQKFGIRVDFPAENLTGGDMDWIYVDPLALGGGKYLRVLLQAKRAHYAPLKSSTSGYWYYDKLDYGDPPGSQAQTLVSYASSSPDGYETCPMYIFYHPEKALTAGKTTKPAVEGVNLVFADLVAPAVLGGCKRSLKKVDYWQEHFLPLSTLLCWRSLPPIFNFQQRGQMFFIDRERFNFHPEIMARRLNAARSRYPDTLRKIDGERGIQTTTGIPDDLQRAIYGESTDQDRKSLKRPRVIFISETGEFDFDDQ